MPTSYNGWDASTSPTKLGIVPLVVDGASFPPGVRSGPVHTVFTYLVHRLITEVEPAGDGCWGYNYRRNRNADSLSCHASGTAIDFNAPKHPNGKRGTFTPAQVTAIERILADIGVIAWGGHFHGTPDEMHFEIHGTPAEVGAAAQRIQQATARPIPAHPKTPEDDVALSDEDVDKVAQRVYQLLHGYVATHQDMVVLLRGTADGKHAANLTNIAKALGVKDA